MAVCAAEPRADVGEVWFDGMAFAHGKFDLNLNSIKPPGQHRAQ